MYLYNTIESSTAWKTSTSVWRYRPSSRNKKKIMMICGPDSSLYRRKNVFVILVLFF